MLCTQYRRVTDWKTDWKIVVPICDSLNLLTRQPKGNMMLKSVFVNPMHEKMDNKRVRIVGISIVVIGVAFGLGWINTPQARAQDAPDIIGGRESAPGAWPWQAAIVFSRYENAYVGQYCGGSLIAPEWVLTAAHCVDGEPAVPMDVVLGRNKLSVAEGERISVTRRATAS